MRTVVSMTEEGLVGMTLGEVAGAPQGESLPEEVVPPAGVGAELHPRWYRSSLHRQRDHLLYQAQRTGLVVLGQGSPRKLPLLALVPGTVEVLQ